MIAAVYFQSLAHIVTDSNIIDDKAIIFAGIFSVDPADGLDQQMPFQRLIIIQISQRRHVKACDPHINDDGNAEIGLILLERGVQFLGPFAVRSAAEILVHIRRIVAGDACHHRNKWHRF